MKVVRRLPRWLQGLTANVRDIVVLLRQFSGPLSAFSLTVVVGGGLYFWLARQAGEARPVSLVESLYLVLSMIFLQTSVTFPTAWYLQIFFFLMPVVGLGSLAQGAADFGVLLFNRRARGEAWQVAVAETYSNHVVIVGMGHLGFRVAQALYEIGENFVIIEQNPQATLVSHAHAWKVPVLNGDSLKQEILRQAGVGRAKTIVICTSDDTMNLQIAIHARAVNPDIRTIIRLFDDEFAREVRNAFGITAAYSASALAAPAFAAAAAGLEVMHSITLNGRVLNLSQLTLTAQSMLLGKTVGQVEQLYDVSVVLLLRGREADLHPNHTISLKVGDRITIFADVNTLHRLNHLNPP